MSLVCDKGLGWAGLGGRVGCSVCHLSCVLGLHEVTLYSLCLSERRVFREGTLCHLGTVGTLTAQ